MAYMKDSTGRRLDSIAVPATTEVAPATIVSPPSGFAFGHLTMPVIRRLGGGKFATNVDALIAAMRPAAGVTYYASPTGSVGADGLTPSTPTTIPVALGKAGIGTLSLAPGEYFRDTHATTSLTTSLNVVASGPGVKLTAFNDPASCTWALYSGAIYSTTRANTKSVVDVTNRVSWGDATVYAKKADAASITAAGQWAIVGSTVYVWAIGSTDLSISGNRSQIRLTVEAQVGFKQTGAGTIYCEGVDFQGIATNGGLSLGGTGYVIAKDCSFKYRAEVNGFEALAGYGAILVRCEASSNYLDGFNYHSSGGVNPDFIEVDCRSHHNGLSYTQENCNGSTSHEYARGIRVGGNYYTTNGPVCSDVNGARTWNLGCRAGDSFASSAAASSWRVDSAYASPTNAAVWCDECTAADEYRAWHASGTAAALYVHAATYETGYRTSAADAGCTVTYYTP